MRIDLKISLEQLQVIVMVQAYVQLLKMRLCRMQEHGDKALSSIRFHYFIAQETRFTRFTTLFRGFECTFGYLSEDFTFVSVISRNLLNISQTL